MTKGRLEAFSDGVLAIIITIMVLELQPPHGNDFGALHDLVPKLIAYALSFVNIGIYWNNHHHLLHASKVVNGRVLWANLFLLFWLSLFPFVTAWMGDAGYSQDSVALYGVIALAGFPFIAFAGYVIVAIMWFIPDRRVEQTLHHGG